MHFVYSESFGESTRRIFLFLPGSRQIYGRKALSIILAHAAEIFLTTENVSGKKNRRIFAGFVKNVL